MFCQQMLHITLASNLIICVILYRLQQKAAERRREEFGVYIANMFLIYAYH